MSVSHVKGYKSTDRHFLNFLRFLWYVYAPNQTHLNQIVHSYFDKIK